MKFVKFLRTPILKKSLFIRVTDLRGFHVNSAKSLTIFTGKTVFYSVQYKNDSFAASDLFDVFTQSIKSYYTLYYTYKEYTCLENVIHQIDSKNEWLLLPPSFTAKFGLVFVLTLENAFS